MDSVQSTVLCTRVQSCSLHASGASVYYWKDEIEQTPLRRKQDSNLEASRAVGSNTERVETPKGKSLGDSSSGEEHSQRQF